ncbi:MAG: ABC transporter permease [Thermoleophilia bacterium]
MVRLVIRGLLSRKLRTILTSIAIVLGVAIVCGTFILTDQINSAFDSIFQTGNEKIDAVVTRQTIFDSSDAETPPLPESIVAQVKRTPGVAVADGQVSGQGQLLVDGKKVESVGGAPTLVVSTVNPALNPSVAIEGHLPEAPGEVALIKDTADQKDITVGQPGVTLATSIGAVPVKVVGIFTFGGKESVGGATLVLSTLRDAQKWFERQGEVTQVVASAEPGVSPTQLKANLQKTLPDIAKVETGQENAEAQASEISDSINSFLSPVLTTFGVLALFVGAFIIFNTFWITVAQRTREFGMIRALGATRGQVMRNVIGEALVIGVLSSIIGLFAGIGIAYGVLAIFDALGFALPAAGASVSGQTVVTALVVGTVVTLLAALLPALRATRVPPIAAAQEGGALPESRFARLAPWIAGLFAIGGIVLIVTGLNSGGGAGGILFSVGVGLLLVFIGVAMAARFFIRPMAKVVGVPIEATRGTTGRLARANAVRNPSRTALTAAVLMIGVTVFVFLAIFSTSLKNTFTGAIDRTVQGDLILQTDNFTTFPASAEQVIRDVPGVETAIFSRFPEVRTQPGGSQFLNTLDPETAPQVLNFDWQNGGSDELFTQLGLSEVLIEKNLAKDTGLKIGDTLTVRTIDGKSGRFRVIGEYKDPVLFTGFTVSNAAADRLGVPPDPSVGVVKFAPGADAAATQQAVKDAVATDYPTLNVDSNAEYKANFEDQINSILSIFYALGFLIAIIVAFGIVNVLALSVVERTREIGMLRAIGTTRPQMRAMVRWEAVITSVIGGVLGIIIGAVFAWIIVKALQDFGFEFSISALPLILILIGAIIVGVIAALIPARRAAHLNPLDALHQE